MLTNKDFGQLDLLYLMFWEVGFCLNHDIIKSSKSYANTNSNFFQTGTLTEDGLDLWGTVPTADNW